MQCEHRSSMPRRQLLQFLFAPLSDGAAAFYFADSFCRGQKEKSTMGRPFLLGPTPTPAEEATQLFDWDSIGAGQLVLVVGKKNTGKTRFVKELLRRRCAGMEGQILHHHEEYSNAYREFYGRVSFVGSADDVAGDRVRDFFQERFDACRLGGRFLVLDGFESLREREFMCDLVIGAVKDAGALCVVTVQYALSLPPKLRRTADVVVIFKVTPSSIRKNLWDDYAWRGFEAFEAFNDAMDECGTRDGRDALVIRMNGDNGVRWLSLADADIGG